MPSGINWHKKQIMKKLNLIAALLLAASSAFAQVPSYVPTNGLVGWWPFNGNANDESGNGNNGTVYSAINSIDRMGNNNSCYDFNYIGKTWGGRNKEVYFPYNSTFNCTNISVNCWINPRQYFYPGDANNPNSICIARFQYGYSNPNGQTWVIQYNANLIRVYIFQAASNNNQAYAVSTYNQPLNLNSWQMISFTYDGSNLKLFLNSNLVANTQTTIPINIAGNSGVSVGVSDQANGCWNDADALIDDIGFWNRALTQQEITALYNAQSCTGSGAITPDGPTTFCAGNYVNLTSDVVGGTYQWKKNGVNITSNGTSRTYKATATGSYTCVATCNGTALTSNAITVTSKTNASATVTASGATSFCLGDSLTLNCTNLGSNYSVQWYRTNVSMENATNYSLVVKQPGTYKVVTKNVTNGCSRISGSAITTSVNCRIAGDVTSAPTSEENTNYAARLIDNELSHGVHIYPNPNNGSFNFTYDGEETGDGILQIINTMGQSIYSSQVSIQEGGYTQEINLGDNYTKGFYIVRLLINGGYNDSRVMVR
ncbi:MAG: hypothetical protein RL516_1138 [Bacteroidota bacterium]|jgi:hypothetical protein